MMQATRTEQQTHPFYSGEATGDSRPVIAHYSEITCGAGCWYAKEEVCHCSCMGKNHGSLLVAGAEQPIRQAKIDGNQWELLGLGSYRECCETASAYCKTLPPSSIYGALPPGGRIYPEGRPEHRYYFSVTDAPNVRPVCIRTVSDSQMKWPEVAAYLDAHKADARKFKPCLVWKRVNWKPPHDTKRTTYTEGF